MSFKVTQVREISPALLSSTKRKTGDDIEVSLAISTSGEGDPKSLIAEVWGALKDNLNKRK